MHPHEFCDVTHAAHLTATDGHALPHDGRCGVESVALFRHLRGAFLRVGAMAVTGVVFEAARRGQTRLQIVTLLGLARVGALLVAVGTLVVAAFGLRPPPKGASEVRTGN